jgi:hypothetical protein
MRTKMPNVSLGGEDDPAKRKDIIAYWRRFPANFFNEAMQKEVADVLRTVSSTSPEWTDALQGDAAAATGLVLRLKLPSRIGIKTDIAMTVLLRTAFENAGAAAVMSHMLQRMPLHQVDRTNLSTSWQVQNIWLKSRRRRAK